MAAQSDTIFAPATAAGRAGVSVIRISGPEAHQAAEALAGNLPPVGRFGLRTLRTSSGDVIDQALVLTFAAPNSFTGEDIVEFQVHGSPAVIKLLLSSLIDTGDARLAKPGEFAQRALENERLSLTEVEGLAALIDAETEAQRKVAQRTLDGNLRDAAEQWRSKLINALALLDARVDFADDDVPEDVSREVERLIEEIAQDLASEQRGAAYAQELRDGFEVAIVGRPNAGKSTLMNAIARRSVALTSEISGTTRDVIELKVDLDGMPVTFLDTAGVHEGGDTLERLGIERTFERAGDADLRVFLQIDDDEAPPLDLQDGDIVRKAKDDAGDFDHGVSGATGYGVPALLNLIKLQLLDRVNSIGSATHTRHMVAIHSAQTSLSNASAALMIESREEMAAAHVRAAAASLDSLIGRVDVEDVLDEIFSSFCLGK